MSWIDSVDATPRLHRESLADRMKAGVGVIRACYSAGSGEWGYGIEQDPLTRRSGNAITSPIGQTDRRGKHGDKVRDVRRPNDGGPEPQG